MADAFTLYMGIWTTTCVAELLSFVSVNKARANIHSFLLICFHEMMDDTKI